MPYNRQLQTRYSTALHLALYKNINTIRLTKNSVVTAQDEQHQKPLFQKFVHMILKAKMNEVNTLLLAFYKQSYCSPRIIK